MKGKLSRFTIILIVSISFGVMAKNGISQPIATEAFNGTSVFFLASGSVNDTTVSIVGPSGFSVIIHDPNDIPAVNLSDYDEFRDGLYTYEITTATGPMVLVKDTIDNGRGENNSHYARKGVKQSGHFRVVNGQIKVFKQFKEPTAAKSY
jgi:hypothetical protein